jgi:hypothetical protein
MDSNVIHMNRLGITSSSAGRYLIDLLHPNENDIKAIAN